MIRFNFLSFLLLAAATVGSSNAQDCSTVQNSLAVDTVPVTVDYVMTVDETSPNGGLFTAQVTYEGLGWVALAFSPTGSMLDSLAVIGFPDAGSVNKYNLGGYAQAQITYAGQQTLMDTSIAQNNTHTVLTFSKYLQEEGEITIDPSANNFILVATGASNEFGYHAHRASLGFPNGFSLETCEATAVAAPVSGCSDLQDSLPVANVPISVSYVINEDPDSPNGGIFTAEVAYEGLGWVALAFSPTGSMVGSTAAIGLPGQGGVSKYNLGGYAQTQVTLSDQQTLMDTACMQNATHTIMTFSKYLKEEGEPEIDPSGTNFILVAAGNTDDLGYHAHRESINFPEGLSLEVCDGIVADNSPTIAPVPTTAAPTQAPVVTAAPTIAPTKDPIIDMNNQNSGVVNCSEFQVGFDVADVPIRLEYTVIADEESPNGGYITAQVTYEGEGYVAMGFSPEGRMIGSLAVIGLPDEDQVSKYNLGGYSPDAVTLADQQTLLNTSIVQNDTHTVLSFSKYLQEEGEITIDPSGTNFILVAAGASNALGFHAHRASLGLALQPCVEGAMATDTSSIPATTTVEIDTKQSSFKAHGIMAALAWGILAPMAIANSLCRHLIPGQGLWFKLHRGFNMMVLLLTIIAVAVVYKALNDTSNGEPRHFQPRDGALGKHHTIGLIVLILAIIQAIGGIMRPHVPEKGEEPSAARVMWVYGHKISGVALLGMGWYQCHSGLVLYTQRFVNDQDYTQVFWIISGTIAAVGVGGKLHGIMTIEPEAADPSETEPTPAEQQSNASGDVEANIPSPQPIVSVDSDCDSIEM